MKGDGEESQGTFKDVGRIRRTRVAKIGPSQLTGEYHVVHPLTHTLSPTSKVGPRKWSGVIANDVREGVITSSPKRREIPRGKGGRIILESK